MEHILTVISNTMQSVRDSYYTYCGASVYLTLFYLAFFYMFCSLRKKTDFMKQDKYFLWLTVVLAVVIVCPVSAWIIMKYCVESTVYRRMFWMIPVPLLIGYVGARAVKYLKPGGRLIVSLANRFGLKYWAGCMDAGGTYFGGIEGSAESAGSGGRTRQELSELLEKSGFLEHHFYYPYPDWDFMTALYSDDYLPDESELRTNLRNYNADRYVLFDERKVYGTLLKEGGYPMYANAFLVIAAKGRN